MLELGIVTYNLARSWNLDTIIERCEAHGISAVELRTTHAHGVEVTIGTEERARVRQLFAESTIRQLSLGSTCENVRPSQLCFHHRQRDLLYTRAAWW